MVATVAAQAINQSEERAEKAIVFSKKSQIFEILREVDRLKLQVLLRYSRTGKAVRGTFSSFDFVTPSVTITSISAAGAQCLAQSRLVKVEFILLSKKIAFVADVIATGTGQIVLKAPDKVVVIERRVNVRFKVPVSCSSFIEFPDRKVSPNEDGTPYYPPGLHSSARKTVLMRIDDVSLGGVAGFTRYSGVANAIKIGDDMQNAILYFPDNYPVPVPVSVRWSKKTTATDNDAKYEEFRQFVLALAGGSVREEAIVIRETFYRVGIQFGEVSKELDSLLRTFIKRVQQAESV